MNTNPILQEFLQEFPGLTCEEAYFCADCMGWHVESEAVFEAHEQYRFV